MLFVGGTNPIAVRITDCKKKFFVNDEDFYLIGLLEQLQSLIDMLNIALDTAVSMAGQMGISVNPSKTEVVLFGSQNSLSGVN